MINRKNIFSGIKKIHLTGIGGIGMSGIAEYLNKKGFEISGSDAALSQVTRRLEHSGIKIFEGHSGDNIEKNCELIIYTSAVSSSNPELDKARKLGIKTVKRAEALGNIVNDKFLIAVSGTHGKSTTTAMIAKILIDNKFDPTVFVGGNLDFLNESNYRIGKSEIAVVEADEYDRSFHHLKADIAVITNIESDHLDIYFDIDDIKTSFKKFLENSKKELKIIACGDDLNNTDIIKKFRHKTTYGFNKSNDFVISEVNQFSNKVNFLLKDQELMIKVMGNHNMLNASAAFLVGREFKINAENFNGSLKTFFGVKRRLELKYENGLRVFDDYAHHPTEVKATIEALRKIYKGRLITVFQPHLYTRTRDFYREFGESFSGTDILILTKIYPAREEAIEGITSELILAEYKKSGKQGFYSESKENLLNELEDMTENGDVIAFLGAGDITEYCTEFILRIKTKTKDTVPL